MNIVLIDNNDSFTFNIVEVLRKFHDCKLTVLKSDSTRTGKLKNFDKIILSPGPGLPEEFPVLKKIITTYHREKPLLGVCLGHEAIGHYFGAALKPLKTVTHGQSKQLQVLSDSVLYENLPKKFNVGLYHSWILDKKKFPADLLITAVSEDGYIMSIQHKKYKLFGVQFHPESIISEFGKELFWNFINVK